MPILTMSRRFPNGCSGSRPWPISPSFQNERPVPARRQSAAASQRLPAGCIGLMPTRTAFATWRWRRRSA